MNSIIGKQYRTFDNSWLVNLTTACNYPYVSEQRYPARAVVNNFTPTIGTILSNPFPLIVKLGKKKKTVNMVLIQIEDEVLSVMYHPSGIVPGEGDIVIDLTNQNVGVIKHIINEKEVVVVPLDVLGLNPLGIVKKIDNLCLLN